MSLTDPKDLIKIVQELGPYWGPPVAGLLIVGGAICFRWKQGCRNFRTLVFNWLVLSVCILCLAGCLVGRFLVDRHWGIPEAFGDNEIGVLVAEVPGDTRQEQQNSYAMAIRSLVANTPDLADVVKVRLLGRPLPADPDQQHKVATSIGRRLHASFVLRAVPVSGGYRSWLTIVDQPEFTRREADVGRLTQAQLQEIDQLALPADVTLLARCAVALSLYRKSQYQDVVNHLTKILEAPELHSAAPPRPFLSFVLGNSYRGLRFTDPASLLPLAIGAYDEALRKWTLEHNRTDWAAAMNNRGTAFSELPGPGRVTNLSEAIRCYNEALKVRTRDSSPIDWAKTMNNMGIAYGNLPGQDRVKNLREAIHCYDEALSVLTRHRYPTEWATTMSNRGSAYNQLPGSDRDTSLREAIRCYDEALKVLTRERYPTAWSTAMSNRGTAFQELQGPDRAVNLKEAIRCFDEALQVRTRDRYPAQWAMTMINRGNAYQDMAGDDSSNNLREAIHSYNSALQVYTHDRYPTQWAMTLYNLGNAHQKSLNLLEAIRCYDRALKVRTRKDFPIQWAMTMSNRASAYLSLRGPDRAANLRETIRSLEQVLVIYKSPDFPDEAAEASRNLEQARRDLAGRSHH